jgi:predicted nucleic acid-binding protein
MSTDFLDSNVLLYQFDRKALQKQSVAREIIANALTTRSAIISFQGVQETLNVLTRKLPVPIAELDVQDVLNNMLIPLMRVMPSAALYTDALRIAQRFKFSFYDALIVAAAQSAGCKRLLTEDMQHGDVIDGLRIVNPFI